MMDTISQHIKEAMKAKDKVRLNTLRYVKKLFIENNTAEKKVPELDILTSYVKQLQKSLKSYPENSEQALNYQEEIKIVQEYLPRPLSEEEVVVIIDEIKSSLDKANMGQVMKELTAKIKGRFDGKKASELVKSALL